MRLISAVRAAAAIFMATAAICVEAADFLSPEEAYSYAVSVQNDRILVSWIVTPGYYLYRKRMGFESATPGVTLGKPIFPQGEMHHDENLGDDEVYRDTATFELPFTVTGARPSEIALKLKWQGCADAGLCYPPSTWNAKVKLPPEVQAKFKAVKTAAELDRAVALAGKQGQRTMLDFTADWCAPCKKMEKTTFADPAVQTALSNFSLLRIDVTQSTAEDAALLRRFKAFGPPVIAFFDAQGREVASCKVTGYLEPGKFREHLDTCQKS